ncbi:DUF1192 domain-containing protein [Rhizobium deserti]|uniref:DUF1192 domain-containing protein n=1 Tax=Rhizobium deserti TaxID=2547961 RepID=A0A4R5UN79_9HYPH|nr:DUF1192 domain-containing protein [Rhizobium deserti]TDK39362.1 DUF1192 domain-containing protein [Rhizobium deserti]
MSLFDNEQPKKPAAHEIGADLSLLSVEELGARVELLKSEILRLEAEMERKAAGRRAADSLFRS